MFYDILANKALILATLANTLYLMLYDNYLLETCLNFMSVLPVITFTDLMDPSVLTSIKSTQNLHAGVYAFRNEITGEIVYVGSSSNLARRFYEHLNGGRSNIILQQAFKKHGLKNFSFIILEYYIFNWDLSMQENLKLLLAMEQKYLDSLKPRYNIAAVAGSPMAGRNHSDESKEKISTALSGENNPNYGKDLSGELNPFFGKTHSDQTKAKISANKSQKVFIYSLDNQLIQEFDSQGAAAKWLGSTQPYVSSLIKSGRIYKNQYILKAN